MCAIGGEIYFDGEVNIKILKNIRNKMKMRGPDGEGLWISKDKKIGLIHARLAINDLSELAKQPMISNNNNIVISFNGEIYNSIELRKILEKLGHNFKTQNSDTEVIIHAYEEWGELFVKRLRGMFAIALYDCFKNQLYLYRDFIGIKPLFYYKDEKFLSFASEIKGIFENKSIIKKVNEHAIWSYLTLLSVPAPETMFVNIYKLEAGTFLKVFSDGTLHKIKYWDSAEYLNNPLYETKEKAIDRIYELLEDTIHLYNICDARKAISLSSGVDSSLLAAINNKSDQAICIDYEDKSQFSESGDVVKIAAELNINNLLIHKITKDSFLSNFNKYYLKSEDYPVSTPDIIMIYIMSQVLNSKKIKVCLMGEGADELGGYPSYLKMNNEREIFLRDGYIEDKEFIFNGNYFSNKHIQSFSETEKKKLWVGDDTYDCTYLYIEKYMNEVTVKANDIFLRQVQNVEFKYRLPEFLLPRVDYSTMEASLEARIPFLDNKLVEYLLRLDKNIMMNNGEVKIIFKELLSRYINEKFVYKKKLGFGKAMIPFLNQVVPEIFFREIVMNYEHPIFQYISRKYTLNMIENPVGDSSFKLWNLYALGKWLELNC